jgi:alpha-tubulin suppressor-like RCC1 family protein
VPVKVGALEGERIETAAVGSNHVLAVTTQGHVYHWGKLHRVATQGENKEYFGVSIRMTGLAANEEDESTARKRRLLDKSHRAYYANKGGKDSADPSGATNDGETGEHETNMDFGNFHAYLQRTPLLIEELALANIRITKVAAGYGFSLLVTDQGHVWSLGINEKFQLGLAHRFNQDRPQLIKHLAAQAVITDVACGQQHSVALDNNQKLWSWGLGVFGQLGHSSLRDEPVPRQLVSFTLNQSVAVPVDDGDPNPIQVSDDIQHASKEIRIAQVACGSHHTLALDTEGRIWSWGSSEYGQQGGSKNYEDLGTREGQSKEQHFYYSIPRLLTGGLNGKRPVKIACGNLHNIALTEDGCMWTWGWGQTGALGHGNRRFQLFPTVINALRGDPIRCIAGGARTSFAVTSGTSTSFAFDFLPWVNNPQYADLTIHLARNKVLHAHKVLVFARCPALRASYELGSRFGDPEHAHSLRFPKLDPLVFQGLLNYLYCDHLRVPPHLVGRLAVLALRLRLPRLVALCERYLSLEEGAERSTNEAELVVPHSTWEDDMKSVLDDQTFSDFELVVEGSARVSTHRIVLHARCDYFSTLFKSAFQDSSATELDLGGLSKDQLVALLTYLYTNSVDHLDSDNIVDLLHSSDRFLIEDLKQTIELRLEQAVDDDSVVDALLISESTATPRLRNACFSRIINNLDKFKSSSGLSKLRDAMPTTLRELDYVATKRGLISAGSLIRCH